MNTRFFIIAMALIFCANIAQAADFTLTSNDIREGQPITIEQVFNGFGCSGKNISPTLKWSGAPEGTKSFVLTSYDPDAPTGSGWWHWIVFNIPANVTTLPQNAGSGKGMPKGAIQSVTDFGTTGYAGPCPPPGTMHRYEFRIFALDVEKLDLDAKTNPALVGFMTRANSIGTTKLTATYTR